MDAISALVDLCRYEAQALVGREAILQIMSTVDVWILSDWAGIQGKLFLSDESTCQTKGTDDGLKELCRMLLYTHHFVDRDMIHLVKQMASKFGLGGYIKIGKPGICLLEGLETNCENFLQSLRLLRSKMRSGGITRRSTTCSAIFQVAGRRLLDNSDDASSSALLPGKVCELEGKDGLGDLQDVL